MATIKEEAIVLRAYDLGEADRILVLLTSDSGLIRAVAKGVKRTKSKFGGRLEPFNRIKVVLHRGRNLHTVTQAEVLDPHGKIREDFRRYLFGEVILEAVEKGVEEGQVIPRLYPAVGITLKVLETGPPLSLACAFLLKFCALIGYRPQLDQCLQCGERVRGGRAALDLSEGGLWCGRCLQGRKDSAQFLMLPEGVAARANALLRQEMRQIELEIGKDLECLALAVTFAESFLGKRLRAARLALEQARREQVGAFRDEATV